MSNDPIDPDKRANPAVETDHAFDELLSGYVDDELTQQQRQLVDVRAERDAAVRAQLAELQALRDRVKQARLSALDERQWRAMMNDRTTRVAEGIGWLLVIGGALTVVGFLLWQLTVDDGTPFGVRLMIGGLYLGLGMLLLSVIRHRLIERKTDKYKDVEI